MRYLFRIVLITVVVWFATGCVEWLNDTQYRVSCSIDKSLRTDSISLMMLEDAYNRVCHVATVGMDSASGDFIFEGQIENPCVAFFKFSNDSTPFYFVLEHGDTQIEIGKHEIVITGGGLNHEYLTYLKQRDKLVASRCAVMDQYLRLVSADSLVNIETERKYAMLDSILCDSLDKVTVEQINRGNPVARIVFDRFANELNPTNLLNIKR